MKVPKKCQTCKDCPGGTSMLGPRSLMDPPTGLNIGLPQKGEKGKGKKNAWVREQYVLRQVSNCEISNNSSAGGSADSEEGGKEQAQQQQQQQQQKQQQKQQQQKRMSASTTRKP
eukprot:1141695-Pelagomonas_calceolata.AAC.2